MSSHCCVPCCSNDSRYDKEKILSFHLIPKDPQRRKQWIIRIRRDIGDKFKITSNTRVCSEHFKDGDFVKTLAGLRKLKDGVEPTQFDWTRNQTATRLPPKKRCLQLNGEDVYSQETCISVATETPSSSADHDYAVPPDGLEDQLVAASAHIRLLEEKILSMQGDLFCLERFANDPEMINFYTGFKNYATLKATFLAFQPTAASMVRWTQVQRHSGTRLDLKGDVFRDESLPLIDQYFLFLTRVRQGFFEADLAIRFKISQATVSRVLTTWANYLYFMLGSLPLWPDKQTVLEHMPSCFQATYPKTRVILDCTEIRVQTPSSKVLNSEIYSNYKSHCTFKGLVGISPSGSVTFISSLYTGSISDKAITASSGIIDLVEYGDEVMADKGFPIGDLLEPNGASLVIPPFLGAKGKFSKAEVSDTQEIARLRIHVERAIRRIKEYHIFDSVVPLSLAGSINQIWTVCCILTTFKGPLF